MPVSPKAQILQSLSASRLRELADHFDLDGPRRSKEELVEAFTRYRKLGAETLVAQLGKDELVGIAQSMHVESSARDKQTLIDRILGNVPPKPRTTPQQPAPLAASPRVSKTSATHRTSAPMTATTDTDQAFLDDLDKKLWNAADRLRANLDAAVYKHAVLGLIFLKYVSDAFDLRREELLAAFADTASEYYLGRAAYASDAEYQQVIHDELEDRDYFTEKNVFWVPPLARWQTIRENAALAPDTVIEIRNGKVEQYTFRSTARLIDDALEAIEKENPRLKGIIEKNRYMQLQLEPSKLIGLISEVVSAIPFRHASLNAKDILGHIPRGWTVATLAAIASVGSGKRPVGRNDTLSPECKIPLYGGGGRMGYVSSVLYERPILFTGRVGTLGLIFRTAEPSWPSDNTLIIEPQDGFFDFTYFALKGFDLITLNRGSTQPLLTQKDLKKQQFVLPPTAIIKTFANYTVSIFKQITTNENQSRTLATLRDTLLPKLLNGEIRLSDIQRDVAHV